jgi:desulfoferrodoxin
MLVTRGGQGELRCCGQPMALRGATTQAQDDKR